MAELREGCFDPCRVARREGRGRDVNVNSLPPAKGQRRAGEQQLPRGLRSELHPRALPRAHHRYRSEQRAGAKPLVQEGNAAHQACETHVFCHGRSLTKSTKSMFLMRKRLKSARVLEARSRFS